MIQVAEIALDALNLIPHLREPLLQGDEALQVAALLEHGKKPLLLDVETLQSCFVVGILAGDILRRAAGIGHIADVPGLGEEGVELVGGDAHGVGRPPIHHGGGAVGIGTGVALHRGVLDKAAQACDGLLQLAQRLVKLRCLHGQVAGVDDLFREIRRVEGGFPFRGCALRGLSGGHLHAVCAVRGAPVHGGGAVGLRRAGSGLIHGGVVALGRRAAGRQGDEEQQRKKRSQDSGLSHGHSPFFCEVKSLYP